MTDPNDDLRRTAGSVGNSPDDEPTAPTPSVNPAVDAACPPGVGAPDAVSARNAGTPGASPTGLAIIALLALVLAGGATLLTRSLTESGSAPTGGAAPTDLAGNATGTAAPLAPDVTLGLYVERDGRAEHLSPGTKVAVGDHLMFELSSDAPTKVRLWIEEDGITLQQLGPVSADSKPAMVGAEDGLLAWGFGSPRAITVRASAAPSGCPASSCASQVVVAR